MSILIKGMNMPIMKDNTGIKMELRKIDGNIEIGIMTGGYSCSEQWHYYPITEVPTPHGDLVDRDNIEVDVWEDFDGLNYQLDCKPVIEAENEDVDVANQKEMV